MEVIHGIKDRDFKKPLGIGLGNFDGLHIGHMALVNTLVNECRLSELYSMVYTFTKHPENVLRKKDVVPLLITPEKKAELLNNYPLNYLFYEEFDEIFSRMQPEDFVKDILVRKLNIRLAVAGFDYTFGYKGRGNSDLLKELGERLNFRVLIIPPIKIDEEIVSSTLIREYLVKGDMEKVFFLLGRRYSIKGTVKKGQGVGSKLGFPTANIYPKSYTTLPDSGVYITKTLIDKKMYKSVTNIGVAPTIKDKSSKTNMETYIIGFNQSIYEKQIEVFFIKKIRKEKKFNNKEELIRQIKSDILKTQNS